MNVIFKVLLATLILFSSCQNPTAKNQEVVETEDDNDNPNLITCDRIGPVLKSYTKADLEEEFGSDALAHERKQIDGTEREITRVFPDQPEEVIVVWEDAAAEKSLKLVIWNENGPYATKEDLKLGIDLRDLVRINNFLSIQFSNFYSSFDGYATILGFNGGNIEENYPCLGGKLDISRLKGVDVIALEDFKKQDTVRSGDPLVQSMEIKVTEISISN